jgi:predicted transcriptional regulator
MSLAISLAFPGMNSMIMHLTQMAVQAYIFHMDGQALQERIKAIVAEIAAIQKLEARYREITPHSEVDRAAHEARREVLENIEQELTVILSKRNTQ